MNSLFSKKINIAFAITLTLLILSCSKKISFQNSLAVPAARGFVKVKKDNNKNYMIRIELNNLAEVGRLQPARKAYVIWMETNEEPVKNIGQIKSSSGMLTSKLKATFNTVSVLKPTKIFITAEDETGIQYPGSLIILTTSGF